MVNETKSLKFYPEDISAGDALADALLWALEMDPSPCRCIGIQLCRAHQAILKAQGKGIGSPYGRTWELED